MLNFAVACTPYLHYRRNGGFGSWESCVMTIRNFIFCCLWNAWVSGWQSSLKCRIPPSLTCCLFPVRCPSVEVQGDLGMSPMLFGRKCHLLCTSRIYQHTHRLHQVIAVNSMSWSAASGFFMAFILVCVPRINNGVFPEAECVNGSGIRIWKL